VRTCRRNHVCAAGQIRFTPPLQQELRVTKSKGRPRSVQVYHHNSEIATHLLEGKVIDMIRDVALDPAKLHA
jgi:hypothetical protein